jgi:hypothetical protein
LGFKDLKVRLGVAEALGCMTVCIDRKSFEEKLQRLLPAYSAMYKKERFDDFRPITHGLSMTIQQAALENPVCLEPHLDLILTTLHPILARPVDFKNPNTLRNAQELLRIYETLARAMPTRVLQWIINRFALKENSEKLGSLTAMRHLVTSMDSMLEDSKPLIMSSVTTLVTETNIEVKKAVLNLIMSMTHTNYMALEGGQTLVRFLLQQTSLRVDSKDNKENKNADLVKGAGHVLKVMSFKLTHTHPVLYPYLFEMITDKKFDRGFVVISTCLAQIAEHKREEQDPTFMVDFQRHVDIPSPQLILSRCMLLASMPFSPPGVGVAALRLLSAIGPMLHEQVGAYFDSSLETVINHLEEQDEESFVESKWQDILLRLFRQTIEQIEDGKWVRDLCTTLGDQFDNYPDAMMKRVLHRYLGTILAKVDSKAQVTATVTLMLSKVDHKNNVERVGCAQGLGFAGSRHLDLVLPKLTDELKPTIVKTSGFFGFGAGETKTPAPDSKVATAALSYGYVVAYADSSLILSRLDVHVMHNMIPMLKRTAHVARLNLVKSVDLLSAALHVSKLPEGKSNHQLSQRDALVTGLLGFLGESKDSKGKDSKDQGNKLLQRVLVVKTLGTLANLQPPLPAELRTTVLKAILKFYDLDASSVDAKAFEGDGQTGEPVEVMLANINAFLSSLVEMDPTVATLVALLQALEPSIISSSSVRRERATESYNIIMKKFVQKFVHEGVAQTEYCVPELGVRLGVICSRLGDSNPAIRGTGTACVQALLYVDQVLRNVGDKRPRQEIKMLTQVKNHLASPDSDSESIMTVIRNCSSFLNACLQINDAIEFIKQLIQSFNDPDEQAGCSLTLISAMMITLRGSEMKHAVEAVVETFLTCVETIQFQNVKSEAFHGLRALASFHFVDVIDLLLTKTVPLSAAVLDCFRGLATPTEQVNLSSPTLEHLLTCLNETPVDEKVPTPLVMTATAALTACFDLEESKAFVDAKYAGCLSSLLMRIGTAQGVDSGASSQEAVLATRAFLTRAGEEELLATLEDELWTGFESKTYDDSITQFIRVWCGVRPEKMLSLLRFLARFYSQQAYVGQRVAAVAILAEFVNQTEDANLTQELIKFLLPRVTDKVVKVRKQALRGLGNMVTSWSPQVSAAATSILSALTSMCEDPVSEVAAEAVASLTRISGVVEEDVIAPMVINIVFRLRSSLDRKEDSVRAASFKLFGVLCRFGAGENKDNFFDQTHQNLPIYLIHAADESDEVSQAAIGGLVQIFQLLGLEAAAKIAEDFSVGQNYDTFLEGLVPIILETYGNARLRSYVDSCMTYFTSSWASCRANSAYLIGCLMHLSSEGHRKRINPGVISTGLIGLLQDKSASVRAKVCKTLAFLGNV